MKITKAYSERDDIGYPALRLLTADGQSIYLHPEGLKQSLLEAGFVYLGSEWETRVPPITLPASLSPGEPTLRGFSTDPVLIRLTQSFFANPVPPGEIPLTD